MKNHFLLTVLLALSTPCLLKAQYIYKIKADSVRIYNDSCTAELIVENRTKDTLGFLYNKGNGRTEFRRALVPLDTSYLRRDINMNTNAIASKEPTIIQGTTSQYWRGDKTWQTLNTTAVPEGANLYYTDTRARAAMTLTTTGTSGAATYDNSTGVFNIPQYTTDIIGSLSLQKVTNIGNKTSNQVQLGSLKIGDTARSISASLNGGFSGGYAGSSGANITASNNGSFAFGGNIASSGEGSIAMGRASYSSNGTIQSTGEGTFAAGSAQNSGILTSSGTASFALGLCVLGGALTSKGYGSLSLGYAKNGTIVSGGYQASSSGPGYDGGAFAGGAALNSSALVGSYGNGTIVYGVANFGLIKSDTTSVGGAIFGYSNSSTDSLFSKGTSNFLTGSRLVAQGIIIIL